MLWLLRRRRLGEVDILGFLPGGGEKEDSKESDNVLLLVLSPSHSGFYPLLLVSSLRTQMEGEKKCSKGEKCISLISPRLAF